MQLKRGFTLVELMVTIAVIVIRATIAAPSMNNLIAKQRLNSAIRELSNTLGKARSQAALLRIEVTVILNTDNSNTANTFYWKPVDDNRLISSTSNITFNPDGTVKNSSGDIDFIVCNSKTKTTKTITLTKIGTQYIKPEGTCT